MKLKGQLQWTDYLNAQILHMKPKGALKVINYGVYVALAVEGIVGFYFLYLFAIEEWYSGLAPIMFLIFIPIVFLLFKLLIRYVILPNRIRKLFAQQKELHAPFELEFTDTDLLLSGEFGNTIRPWKNFIKWKEDEELITLYHSDILFTMIPKRLLTDPQQLELIKSFIAKYGIRAA